MNRGKIAMRVSAVIIASLISACALRPSLPVGEQGTEDKSAIKLVKLDLDSSGVADTPANKDKARNKLLTDIKAECATHRLLTEGTSGEPLLIVSSVQAESASPTEPARYYWIRYECDGI